jgi:hypothetical protein
MCQWLDKSVLQTLPTLQLDTQLQEVEPEDSSNKYGYLYHVYYPEDPAKEPIGVVFYQGKFHRFFHSETIGNPYLGLEHKEVNQYELFKDDATTEGSTKEQLTLQIYNLLVLIDKDQPGSPERTQEPWGPDSTPTITPATYSAAQKQPRLQMATTTETISRTLDEGTTQHETTQELSQSAKGPRRARGSIPFSADRLGGSYPNEGRIRATLFDAFRKRTQHGGGGGGRGPPEDYDPDDGPPDDEPNGADLQDHVPIPPVHDIKAMGSLPQIFNRDRTRADAFLTEFLGYLLLNQGVPGFESPI